MWLSLAELGQSEPPRREEEKWGNHLEGDSLFSCLELLECWPQMSFAGANVSQRHVLFLGVFGACSRCTQSEVSERGITARALCIFWKFKIGVVLVHTLC